MSGHHDALSSEVLVAVGALVLLSIPLLLGFVFIASSRTYRKKVAAWRKLPTFKEYIAQNPQCKTNPGPACNKCQATRLLNRGLKRPDSPERTYVCAECRTELFRSES